MTVKKKMNMGSKSSRGNSCKVPPPEPPSGTIFTVIRGFRVINRKTREQYFAWTRAEAMQVLVSTLRHWTDVTIDEGEYPDFLFY